MLVLTRKSGESVCVGSAMEVRVLAVRGGRVQLGFLGAPDIIVQRSELLDSARHVASAGDRLTCAKPTEVAVLDTATV